MAGGRFIHILKRLPWYIKTQTRLLVLWWLFKIAKNWVILNRIHPRLRPAIWRLTGCKIGKNVTIGYDVYYDVTNASYIDIEDGVAITSRCLILCHRRDMSGYFVGDDYNNLPYIKGKVTIKRGSAVGMGSIILPGVTIGEGSMVAAGSIVTKDVPPWTIVGGNPAKVMRQIQQRGA